MSEITAGSLTPQVQVSLTKAELNAGVWAGEEFRWRAVRDYLAACPPEMTLDELRARAEDDLAQAEARAAAASERAHAARERLRDLEGYKRILEERLRETAAQEESS